MKAAVYKGKRRLVVAEIPTPEPGPGQVLVRVRLSAICGTDVHAYMYDAPRPGTVMGHEYCGTIAAVGDGVTSWSEGDRVVGGGGIAPAGSLPSFKGARFNYRTMGFDAKPVRAYAEYVLDGGVGAAGGARRRFGRGRGPLRAAGCGRACRPALGAEAGGLGGRARRRAHRALHRPGSQGRRGRARSYCRSRRRRGPRRPSS